MSMIVVWSGETTRTHLSSHTAPSLVPCHSARPEYGGRLASARHMAQTAVMPLLLGTHCAITGSLPVGRTRVRRPSGCRPTHDSDRNRVVAAWHTLCHHRLPACRQDPSAAAVWLRPDPRHRQQSHRCCRHTLCSHRLPAFRHNLRAVAVWLLPDTRHRQQSRRCCHTLCCRRLHVPHCHVTGFLPPSTVVTLLLCGKHCAITGSLPLRTVRERRPYGSPVVQLSWFLPLLFFSRLRP